MAEPVLLEAYLDILWHSLGMTSKNYRRSLAWWCDNDTGHRNHFCHAVGNPEHGDLLDELVRRGWMKAGQFLNGDRNRYYHVTDEGTKMARANFPRASRKG